MPLLDCVVVAVQYHHSHRSTVLTVLTVPTVLTIPISPFPPFQPFPPFPPFPPFTPFSQFQPFPPFPPLHCRPPHRGGATGKVSSKLQNPCHWTLRSDMPWRSSFFCVQPKHTVRYLILYFHSRCCSLRRSYLPFCPLFWLRLAEELPTVWLRSPIVLRSLHMVLLLIVEKQ